MVFQTNPQGIHLDDHLHVRVSRSSTEIPIQQANQDSWSLLFLSEHIIDRKEKKEVPLK